MIEINWSTIKSFITQRNLPLQYFDDGNNYHLFAFDGMLGVTALIPQDSGADQADFEANYKAAANVPQSLSISPFASKRFGSKKLWKRKHGIRQTLAIGSNEFIFVIPYIWAKFTAIEVVGAEVGDYADLYVLDRHVNPQYRTPDAVLAQFAYTCNIAPGYYLSSAEFDSDIYLDMQLKAVYNSVSAKTVGINFIMNEVK